MMDQAGGNQTIRLVPPRVLVYLMRHVFTMARANVCPNSRAWFVIKVRLPTIFRVSCLLGHQGKDVEDVGVKIHHGFI